MRLHVALGARAWPLRRLAVVAKAEHRQLMRGRLNARRRGMPLVALAMLTAAGMLPQGVERGRQTGVCSSLQQSGAGARLCARLCAPALSSV
mmetsp:Transcript_8752/g.27556  ORF Transcript_8752/g.27556 Transcript_8752/m.27556 type:complete len:92 (+) Transcript_8752:261-536(+)